MHPHFCRQPVLAESPFLLPSPLLLRGHDEPSLSGDWNGPNYNAATPFSPLPPFLPHVWDDLFLQLQLLFLPLFPPFLPPLSTMAPRYKGGKEVAHPDDNSGGSIWKKKGREGMFSPLLLVPSRESDFGLFNGNQCIFSPPTPRLSMHFLHCLNPQASRGEVRRAPNNEI